MTAKEFSAQIEKTVQRIAEVARSPQLRTIMRPLTRGLPARYRDLPFATQEWRLKRAEEWDELLTQIIEGNIAETRLAADQLGTSIYRSPSLLRDDSLAPGSGSERCGNRGFSDYRIT